MTNRDFAWNLFLLVLIFWLLAWLLGIIGKAHSHPGGVDTEGCHRVTKDYKYIVSKKIVKAGTTHCHAGLGKMRIGKEILEDPYDAAEEMAPAKKKAKK